MGKVKNRGDSKVVMTFGTFDHLHPGHEYYLKEARKYGDYLITVVARDKTTKTVKWRPTRENEEFRVQKLIDSHLADEVLLGSETDYYAVIKDKRPDILCFGYDQQSFNGDSLEHYLYENHLAPKIVILDAFEPEKWKSSKL